MEPVQYTVSYAERLLEEGTASAADLVLRDVLARTPRDPAAWEMLARVAERVGLTGHAERYRITARALDLKGPMDAAAALPAVAPERGVGGAGGERSGERFLLIKAWGWGFFSDVDHVAGALLLAEMTGRTPVTHWGKNSLFSVDPEQDSFRSYFEPVSPLGIGDLIGKGYDFWPPKWNDGNLREERLQKQSGTYSRLGGLEFLSRPERVAVSDYHVGVSSIMPWLGQDHPMYGRGVDEVQRYIIQKYLRPAADIREQIDEFAAAWFGSRPIVAAHVRGSDKFKEDAQLQQKVASMPMAIDYLLQNNPAGRVFLLTDSTPIVEQFRQRYGPRLITTDCFRTSMQQGLHYLGHTDKRRLGFEVVRDAYLALRCDKFTGIGSSNVSCFIYHGRDWPAGSVAVLGDMMTHRQAPTVYMTFEQLERHFPKHVVDVWRNMMV